MQGNPNDTRGGAGTCSGDSGGPVFLDDYLVTVSSSGFNTICRSINGYQRTDAAVVQDWLVLTTDQITTRDGGPSRSPTPITAAPGRRHP
nr:trypsin-like serine protease [Arthrobacter antioxidans]